MNWSAINFDWNRTRAFLATAEEGSFSAAAIALNTSQPTLSRQVAALEEELGITLFNRLGHQLELTEHGLALLQMARNMASAASDLALVAQGKSQELAGNVVISACELDAMYRLPKILSEFRAVEPKISIEVVVTNAVSDLKRREADIAIRYTRPDQASLFARKLGDESIYMYATADYLAQFGTVTGVDQLNSVQIIGFSDHEREINHFKQQGWSLTKDNFMLASSFQPMHVQLAKAGAGLVYLTHDVGDKEAGLVRAFEEFTEPMRLPMWLVCHSELRTNLRVKRVYDYLGKALQDYLNTEAT
ncbi:LysR family transcriptional regulator [Marinomonas epiphytica]